MNVNLPFYRYTKSESLIILRKENFPIGDVSRPCACTGTFGFSTQAGQPTRRRAILRVTTATLSKTPMLPGLLMDALT